MVLARFDLASLLSYVDLTWAARRISAGPAIQLTVKGCQCVHGRFRVHAVIILDAAMVAPLVADKLFRIVFCREHSLPNSPYHRDVSTP